MSEPTPPFPESAVALTIAGSDNSAGAGIQADLKTFGALSVYGLTAVTCVVAEVPGRVFAVQPVDLAVIRDQVRSSLEAFPVRAIKTGMLHSRAVIELVAYLYAALDVASRPPLVVDPVMVASSGDALLEPDAITVYQDRLFPLATLVTPNLDEAHALLGGQPIRDEATMRAAGRELVARHGTAFLMKGGHLGGDVALDVLCLPGGASHDFASPFLRGISTHGTGCTYSAAITAQMAKGSGLVDAVGRAKQYMKFALEHAHRWTIGGRQTNALRHPVGNEFSP